MDLRNQDKFSLELIRNLSGNANIRSIPRILILLTGDYASATLLNEIAYWTGKGADPDGWIFKTYEDLKETFVLSEYQIRQAKKNLEVMGLIETKVKKAYGNPTVHYRLNESKLLELLVPLVSKETNLKNQRKRNLKNSRIDTEENNESITKNITTLENTTTTDECGSLSSPSQIYFSVPRTGIEIEKIADRVIRVQYPDSNRILNVHALRGKIKNLLREGRLQIPEGWEHAEKKKGLYGEIKNMLATSNITHGRIGKIFEVETCPFCRDENRKFYMNGETGNFACKNCGVKGDFEAFEKALQSFLNANPHDESHGTGD